MNEKLNFSKNAHFLPENSRLVVLASLHTPKVEIFLENFVLFVHYVGQSFRLFYFGQLFGKSWIWIAIAVQLIAEKCVIQIFLVSNFPESKLEPFSLYSIESENCFLRFILPPFSPRKFVLFPFYLVS